MHHTVGPASRGWPERPHNFKCPGAFWIEASTAPPSVTRGGKTFFLRGPDRIFLTTRTFLPGRAAIRSRPGGSALISAPIARQTLLLVFSQTPNSPHSSHAIETSRLHADTTPQSGSGSLPESLCSRVTYDWLLNPQRKRQFSNALSMVPDGACSELETASAKKASIAPLCVCVPGIG